MRVHPRRIQPCAERSHITPARRVEGFLERVRRWLCCAFICSAFLVAGYVGGLVTRDYIREAELSSVCAALHRAVASAGETCVVCLDRPPGSVILDCGHLLCTMCAEERTGYFVDRGCPTCRGEVSGIMHF